MTEDNIRVLYKNVNTYIERRRLKEALDLLRRWARHESMWTVFDRLSELQENYKRMLDFVVEGIKDPYREDLYKQMCQEALETADKLRFIGLKGISNNPIYEDARDEGEREDIDKSISDLMLIEARLDSHNEPDDAKEILFSEYYNTLGKLFRNIQGSGIMQSSDKNLLKEYLYTPSTSQVSKSLIISALTISLFEVYDKNKVILLLDCYESEDNKSRARAIVGILGAMILYGQRLKDDDDINDIINSFLITGKFKEELEIAILNIVKTRETKRIQRQMAEEIIPEIMKIRSEISQRLGDSTEISPENLESNPEWDDIIMNSPLKDKLKELNDLQIEGSDVMLSAFSQLKGFSFFNLPVNWFMPFSINHPDVSSSFKQTPALGEILSTIDMMCDSDKYSFSLSLHRMPESQRKSVLGQLESQLIHFKEEKAGAVPETESKIFEKEINGYIRDIYRFFTLFPRAKKMVSGLFDREFSVDSLPDFCVPVFDNDLLNLLAEFYLSKKFYPEAITIIERLLDNDEGSSKLYQKLGFAYSCVKNYSKALENYQISELMEGSSIWLSNQMGNCYKALGRYEVAAECFKSVYKEKPDSYSTILNLGHCLMSAGNFEEALKAYYHAYYLKGDNLSLIRALAWCELRLSNYEKSREFYEKIILNSPTDMDFLNYGHLAILEGNLKQGVELYRQAALENEDSEKWIRKSLADDSSILESLGIDKDIQQALADYVLFSLKKD